MLTFCNMLSSLGSKEQMKSLEINLVLHGLDNLEWLEIIAGSEVEFSTSIKCWMKSLSWLKGASKWFFGYSFSKWRLNPGACIVSLTWHSLCFAGLYIGWGWTSLDLKRANNFILFRPILFYFIQFYFISFLGLDLKEICKLWGWGPI